MSHFFKLLILMIFFVPFTHAEVLEIKVTRISNNFFKIDQKPILIQTQNCNVKEKHTNPVLKISDTSKVILFHQPEGKCDVKAAYKKSSDGMGNYSVIIQHEETDWYAILNTDSYIRTKQCASLVQGKKAILSLNGSQGTLIIDQLECRVDGVYTKLE